MLKIIMIIVIAFLHSYTFRSLFAIRSCGSEHTANTQRTQSESFRNKTLNKQGRTGLCIAGF